MKIFISSLIKGFEPFRAAARAAVKTLRHEAIMAEDFAAQLSMSTLFDGVGVKLFDGLPATASRVL